MDLLPKMWFQAPWRRNNLTHWIAQKLTDFLQARALLQVFAIRKQRPREQVMSGQWGEVGAEGWKPSEPQAKNAELTEGVEPPWSEVLRAQKGEWALMMTETFEVPISTCTAGRLFLDQCCKVVKGACSWHRAEADLHQMSLHSHCWPSEQQPNMGGESFF
jgi:hypothetical protein